MENAWFLHTPYLPSSSRTTKKNIPPHSTVEDRPLLRPHLLSLTQGGTTPRQSLPAIVSQPTWDTVLKIKLHAILHVRSGATASWTLSPIFLHHVMGCYGCEAESPNSDSVRTPFAANIRSEFDPLSGDIDFRLVSLIAACGLLPYRDHPK